MLYFERWFTQLNYHCTIFIHHATSQQEGEQPGGGGPPTSLVSTLTLKSKRDNILLLSARYTCNGSCLSLERNVRITLLASGRCPIFPIEESWMGKTGYPIIHSSMMGPILNGKIPLLEGIWLFACKLFIAWYGTHHLLLLLLTYCQHCLTWVYTPPLSPRLL